MAKKKMSENSLKNLEKRVKFKKSPQGLDDAKSNGQINLSIEKNIISTLRTEIQNNTTILKDIPQALQEEVSNGKLDNAIKLLNIIKEPEKQELVNEIKTEKGLQLNILPVKTDE